ncbi:glycosyltransferase family 39 protein, partial [bacterium]|nr:glycosyltransferase family 39 protein [bacterium]
MVTDTHKHKHWLAVIWVVGALAIGGFLRFYNLGGPSIWVDELNHLYAGKSLLEHGQPSLPSGELYPRALIYSELVSYSFRLLGIGELSLRLPSAVFGIFCLLLAFYVTKRFFGSLPALLTVLFMAISPFEIGWSRLSRMYTLFQFLFLLTIYAFYLGFESDGLGRLARLQDRILRKFAGQALTNFVQKWQLNLIWLLITVGLLWLSYLVHQLAALFCVGVLLYLLVMFIVRTQQVGIRIALTSKYFILLGVAVTLSAVLVVAVPKVGMLLEYALTYTPKWANMPKFQDSKLYLDFIFDNYHFPVGVLFVVGGYQVISRLHQFGIYALSVFVASLFMFTFVFSYRHLQYMYHVYPVLIALSAYAFANIIRDEFPKIRRSWFSNSRLRQTTIKSLVVSGFLVWIPLLPSVRLAKNIPFNNGGNFNGAVFLTEMRQACEYVDKRLGEDDIIVSSDALGTLYYLGRVDLNLNFSDFD